MPVTADQPAPYAPAKAVLDLIGRHRNKGLPTPVDADVLARAGIPASLISRTLQALQTLDLIDENGAPSQVLEGIRLAQETDYKQRLADWLNGAYADALAFVDPASADESQIRDAFRNYKPIGQQSRMVTLFIGLFDAAGIGPEKQRSLSRKPPSSSPAKPTRNPPKPNGGPTVHQHMITGALPPPLAGLLAGLPQDGQGWSKTKRDQFMVTFEAVLDFCFPVISKEQSEPEPATPSEKGMAGFQ